MNQARPFRPVVLLGAGRSGTTLLYKLLALHAQVAYLSNYEARFPRWVWPAALQRGLRERTTLKISAWFKADGGAYIGPAGRGMRALIPAPVEAEPVFSRFGFPLRPPDAAAPEPAACSMLGRHLARLQRVAGASVIVVKRTANNRRIPWFEAMGGDVRYVRIVRDGRAVTASLLNVDWWGHHMLFWAGKTPAQLEREGCDPIEIAARNWVEEESLLDSACGILPSERLHTLHYEDLMREPEATLTAVLGFLALDCDRRYFAALASLGLRPAGGHDAGAWTFEQASLVERLQRPLLRRFGYQVKGG